MQNFEKISILVKIYAKFRFLWKFSKNFENFEILWYEWNFRNKFGFDQNFRFFRKFRKISIWVRFSWHSILAKFLEKIDFYENFEKILIWVKFSKQFDCGQIFEKFRFQSKFSKNFDFFRKFEIFLFVSNFRKKSILVKFSKNIDFGQNFRNFFFGNFENIRFWSNFLRILILVRILEKNNRFFRKFRKISILENFF